MGRRAVLTQSRAMAWTALKGQYAYGRGRSSGVKRAAWMARRCQMAGAMSRGSVPASAFSTWAGVASASRGSKARGSRRAGASPTAWALVCRSRKKRRRAARKWEMAS